MCRSLWSPNTGSNIRQEYDMLCTLSLALVGCYRLKYSYEMTNSSTAAISLSSASCTGSALFTLSSLVPVVFSAVVWLYSAVRSVSAVGLGWDLELPSSCVFASPDLTIVVAPLESFRREITSASARASRMGILHKELRSRVPESPRTQGDFFARVCATFMRWASPTKPTDLTLSEFRPARTHDSIMTSFSCP